MNQMTFDEMQEAWKAQVKEVAESKTYRSVQIARDFFSENLRPEWRQVMSIDDDEVNLIDLLGITDTMLLMLRVYCLGYAPNRRELKIRSKSPVFACWPPYRTTDRLTAFHAIPKRDLAKIIGKSVDSIETALTRFRGNGSDKAKAFSAYSLAVPVAVPTGVMLDCKLTSQASFSFVYEDYQIGKDYAERQSIKVGEVYDKQASYCDKGRHAKRGMRLVGTQQKLTGTDWK